VIYESPEKSKLPSWGAPMPGLYTVSADPMILIYNKKLLAENLRPNGLTNLAELAAKNPAVFNGKITTYDISSAFGYAINWAYVRDRGDSSWKALEQIGPMAKPEKSGGPMVEKVTSGEYVAGYFVSGITFFPKAEQLKDIVGWSYIKDGAPMFLRGVVIPKAGKNVNAAKLLVDFMLSHDGQVALGKGGVVPFRTDVKAEEVPRSYQSIVKEIGGEDKAVLINYDEKSAAGQAGFVDKWKKAFKR
jgi:iron(III) transport system substrate-binding protein